MLSLPAALLAVSLSGAGQTVFLDFYSDSCGPCRAMNPAVQELAAKGYLVRKVNIDHEPALRDQFHVERIPCFVMLVDGKEVDRVVGGTTFSRLERMCKMGFPRPAANPAPVAETQLAASKAGPSSGASFPTRPDIASLPQAGPPNWTARGPGADPRDAALLAATVRLRIEDAGGHSCGTGTIIDARDGEALILTCGHLFRDSQGKGRIEVDLFGPTPAGQVPGRLIAYDLKRDVGLVTIRAPGPVVVAHVAPPDYQIRQGNPVASVGCNNGEDPTVQHSQVTSLNRYAGPANIQVAGQPVVGRSGGGLFSAEGLVIGVCNAADRDDREGLFAALGTIQSELDETNLAYIYRPGSRGAAPKTALAAATRAMPPTTPPRRVPAPGEEPAGRPMVAAAPSQLAPGEREALDELRRHVKEGAEAVIILRRDPQAKCEVLMVDRASPAFVQQLTAAVQRRDGPHETALEIPRHRTPILEWDNDNGWRHREPIPRAAGL